MHAIEFREPGLQDIWLTSGCEVVETEFGKAVRYRSASELMDAIALALVRKPTRLSSGEFRWLRRHVELSQSELATILDRDSQTVSLIERGRLPDALVDRELRRAAAERLPEGGRALGSLHELAARTNRIGPVTIMGGWYDGRWTFSATEHQRDAVVVVVGAHDVRGEPLAQLPESIWALVRSSDWIESSTSFRAVEQAVGTESESPALFERSGWMNIAPRRSRSRHAIH